MMKFKIGNKVRVIEKFCEHVVGKVAVIIGVDDTDNTYTYELDSGGWVNDRVIELVRHENGTEEPPTPDVVEQPSHYRQGRVEVIDVIEDAVQGADPFEAVCQANVLKYVLRYRHKNGIEDLRKSRWYLTRMIDYLEEQAKEAAE